MSRQAGFAYVFKKFPVFAQTFVAREVEGMEAHGCRPAIYSLQLPEPCDQEGFEALRRRVQVIPSGLTLSADILRHGLTGRLPCRAFFSGAWLGSSKRRRREALWLGPRLRAAGVGHVHTHFTGPSAYAAWWLRQDFGISYSITAHANDFLSDAAEPPGLERLLGDASFVIAVSSYSRDLLAKKFPKAHVVCVYNGMRLGEVPPGPPATPPRLVAVGRLVEKKGYPILIEACRLLRSHGVDFRCEIIGDGPMEAELRGQIAATDLHGIVELSGPRTQPEIRAALASARIFALPCVEEKSGGMDILPTVITEAMAAGLPVVSTRLAGIPEMVIEGYNGLLVPPGDAAMFANALQELLARPEWARTMGANGRCHAERLFSEDVTIPQLLTLLPSAKESQDV